MPLKGPLPPQRFGFLPTKEFWELAMYTPFWPLSVVGYICLLAALAYVLGVSVSDFMWWHHVLLAIVLTDIWSGIFERCCRGVLRRRSRARLSAPR